MRRPTFAEKLCDRIEFGRIAGRIVSVAPWHPDHGLIPRARKQNAVGIDLIGDRGFAVRLLPTRTGEGAHDPIDVAIAADEVIAPTQADVVELQPLACELRRRYFERIRGANIRPPAKKPVGDGVGVEMWKVRRQAIRNQSPRACAATRKLRSA